jgi:hypothetical protein
VASSAFRVASCAAFVVSCVATAAPARADESDAAAAEALFLSARELMAHGHFDDACPKLEASQRLDPALGTMLNLAFCYESRGQLASAWALYRDAGALAERQGEIARGRFATEHAALLADRLPTIEIRAAREDDVKITRDGARVEPAVLGARIPVDPGKHVVRATGAGRVPWETVVIVDAQTRHTVVDVPVLEREPASAPEIGHDREREREREESVPPPRAHTSEDAPPSFGVQRTAAVALGGAGVVGAVTGTVFGAIAISKWNDATHNHCRDLRCDDTGLSLSRDARTSSNASTFAFVVGGAAIAGAATLWLTAPRARVAAGVFPVVGDGARGVGVTGAF